MTDDWAGTPAEREVINRAIAWHVHHAAADLNDPARSQATRQLHQAVAALMAASADNCRSPEHDRS